MLAKLTDAEKASLTTMTTQQKQAFLEAKRAAIEQAQDAKEAIITKLINGEALTDTEKTLLVTIKQERADRLAKRDAMKKQRTEMHALMQKKKSGDTLTADERAKLDSFAPME
jgi:ribosomal protein S17